MQLAVDGLLRLQLVVQRELVHRLEVASPEVVLRDAVPERDMRQLPLVQRVDHVVAVPAY